MSSPIVLVVDADDGTREIVRKICADQIVDVHCVRDADAARPIVARGPAVVLTAGGRGWIAELRGALPDAVIAVIGATDDLGVIDAGADLVLARPLDEETIASLLQTAVAQPQAEVAAAPLSLLVIEPEPHLAVVMKRWLGATYTVTVVTTGRRAIDEIRRVRPDIVLAELRLSDMEASELHAAVETHAPGLADRVLFMTTGFIADSAQRFLARIPGQWIHKPFELAGLRQAIDALMA